MGALIPTEKDRSDTPSRLKPAASEDDDANSFETWHNDR